MDKNLPVKMINLPTSLSYLRTSAAERGKRGEHVDGVLIIRLLPVTILSAEIIEGEGQGGGGRGGLLEAH